MRRGVSALLAVAAALAVNVSPTPARAADECIAQDIADFSRLWMHSCAKSVDNVTGVLTGWTELKNDAVLRGYHGCLTVRVMKFGKKVFEVPQMKWGVRGLQSRTEAWETTIPIQHLPHPQNPHNEFFDLIQERC